MAKVSLIQRNEKRIKIAKALYLKRVKLKSRIYDKKISLEDRFLLIMSLAKLPKDSSLIRIRNRCKLSGRPRGNFRKFQLSRNLIRSLGSNGLLPGLIKSSW